MFLNTVLIDENQNIVKIEKLVTALKLGVLMSMLFCSTNKNYFFTVRLIF